MLEEDLSEEHICEIANKIGDCWKDMPHLFNLTGIDIKDIIDEKGQSNPKGQMYK